MSAGVINMKHCSQSCSAYSSFGIYMILLSNNYKYHQLQEGTHFQLYSTNQKPLESTEKSPQRPASPPFAVLQQIPAVSVRNRKSEALCGLELGRYAMGGWGSKRTQLFRGCVFPPYALLLWFPLHFLTWNWIVTLFEDASVQRHMSWGDLVFHISYFKIKGQITISCWGILNNFLTMDRCKNLTGGGGLSFNIPE